MPTPKEVQGQLAAHTARLVRASGGNFSGLDPSQWEEVADGVAHPTNKRAGTLVRNRNTGHYALATGGGTIVSVPRSLVTEHVR